MTKKLEHLGDEIIETDFLVIGGGLAGCMAAIQAKKVDNNVDVTIIEKATLEYSGNGVGIDHYCLEFPSLIMHPLPKDFGEESAKEGEFGVGRFKGLFSSKLAVAEAKNFTKAMVLIEELGVPLREDDGTCKVIQTQRVTGGPTWNRTITDPNGKLYDGDKIFYRGGDVKGKLAKGVKKIPSIKLITRTVVTSIITKDGVAVGATALNTRTGQFIVIKAKMVMLSTGRSCRLYPYQRAAFPNNLFYSLCFPGNHGGGIIAALNAGAKINSMEFIWVYTVGGGINSSSGGGSGWYYKMHNSKGEYLEDKYPDRILKAMGGAIPTTNFMTAPNFDYPECERDVIKSDMSVATRDEEIFNYFTAATEAQPRVLKFHMLKGGVKAAGDRELFLIMPGQYVAGVMRTNVYSETTVKNLFAVGDVSGRSGGSVSINWGHLVGNHAGETVKNVKQGAFDTEQLEQIAATKEQTFAPLNRKTGAIVNPLDLEDYIRNVNNNYIGTHKIKARLDRAVELIRAAKQNAVPSLAAKTPHELMRALEARDIVELSEMHAVCSILRNETRMAPSHYRIDFPETNQGWDGVINVIQKVDGELKYTRETID